MDVSRRTLLRTVAAGTVLTAGCTGASSDPDGERMTTGGSTTATVQIRDHPDLGSIMVGPEDMTLYMFDRDTQGSGESSCSGGCLDNWPPLTVDGEASAGGDVTADLSTFEREDGSTQVAANGWPLYYFTPDEEPGDASGQGVSDVWWVLRPDGSVVRSTGTAEGTSTPTDSRY